MFEYLIVEGPSNKTTYFVDLRTNKRVSEIGNYNGPIDFFMLNPDRSLRRVLGILQMYSDQYKKVYYHNLYDGSKAWELPPPSVEYKLFKLTSKDTLILEKYIQFNQSEQILGKANTLNAEMRGEVPKSFPVVASVFFNPAQAHIFGELEAMSASREEMLQNIETINTCITTNVSFKNTPVKFRNIIGKIYEETAPEGSTTTWEQIRSKLLEQVESRYPQSNWNGNAAVPPSPPAPEWQGPALPPGWLPKWSKTKGKFYFQNIATKETTWNMPPPVPVQVQRDAAAAAAPFMPRSGRLMDPSPLFVGGSFTGSSSPAATAVGQGFYSEEEVPRQPPRSSLYITRPKSWGGRGVSPSEGGANWRGGSRKKKCARKTRKVKSRNKKKAF